MQGVCCYQVEALNYLMSCISLAVTWLQLKPHAMDLATQGTVLRRARYCRGVGCFGPWYWAVCGTDLVVRGYYQCCFRYCASRLRTRSCGSATRSSSFGELLYCATLCSYFILLCYISTVLCYALLRQCYAVVRLYFGMPCCDCSVPRYGAKVLRSDAPVLCYATP